MKAAQSKPLAGRVIALAESRQLDLLADMIETLGGKAYRCPLVAIHDSPDTPAVEQWLTELANGQFADVVLYTGEGLRRLLGFAERMGNRAAVEQALAKARKITRGPKPAKALREIGLVPDLAADKPTTQGLIEAYQHEPVSGRTIGVQLYPSAPQGGLVEFLESQGATVRAVTPYVYAPASDADKVVELIDAVHRGAIDVVAFTSASQVDRLWEVAVERKLEAVLSDGLQRCRVAAVGPVVAENLQRRGVRVDIAPQESFFMRPLVNAIVKDVAT